MGGDKRGWEEVGGGWGGGGGGGRVRGKQVLPDHQWTSCDMWPRALRAFWTCHAAYSSPAAEGAHVPIVIPPIIAKLTEGALDSSHSNPVEP